MNLDELEKVARAALVWSETIGETNWFEASALQAATIDGLEGVIGEPDAAHIVAFDPPTVLRLLAAVKAAKEVAASEEGSWWPSQRSMTAIRAALEELDKP